MAKSIIEQIEESFRQFVEDGFAIRIPAKQLSTPQGVILTGAELGSAAGIGNLGSSAAATRTAQAIKATPGTPEFERSVGKLVQQALENPSRLGEIWLKVGDQKKLRVIAELIEQHGTIGKAAAETVWRTAGSNTARSLGKSYLEKLALSLGVALPVLALWYGSDNVRTLSTKIADSAKFDFDSGVLTKEEALDKIETAQRLKDTTNWIDTIPLLNLAFSGESSQEDISLARQRVESGSTKLGRQEAEQEAFAKKNAELFPKDTGLELTQQQENIAADEGFRQFAAQKGIAAVDIRKAVYNNPRLIDEFYKVREAFIEPQRQALRNTEKIVEEKEKEKRPIVSSFFEEKKPDYTPSKQGAFSPDSQWRYLNGKWVRT